MKMSSNISQMVRCGLPAESDDFKPMLELPDLVKHRSEILLRDKAYGKLSLAGTFRKIKPLGPFVTACLGAMQNTLATKE